MGAPEKLEDLSCKRSHFGTSENHGCPFLQEGHGVQENIKPTIEKVLVWPSDIHKGLQVATALQQQLSPSQWNILNLASSLHADYCFLLHGGARVAKRSTKRRKHLLGEIQEPMQHMIRRVICGPFGYQTLLLSKG